MRALTGVGLLGWEAQVEHLSQWWVLILIVWLLGGPLEQMVTLFTSGRIQINVKREDPPPDEPEPDDPPENEDEDGEQP